MTDPRPRPAYGDAPAILPPATRASATRSPAVFPPATFPEATFPLAACILAFAFVALALVVRAPSLAYTDLNWDEGLYRLIAGSLLHGHAPYLEVWDRKPVGVFVILAGAEALLGESVAAMRIATALSVAAGAWCLAGVASALFGREPGRAGWLMGSIAGALFVLLSVRGGGEGTNTELFFVPLEVAGLWLLLRSGEAAPRPGLALVAGLLMGAAVQVKYNAAFDIAGFGLMFLIVRQRGLGWAAWRRTLVVAWPATAGILLPTLAVLAWYALIGHFGDWMAANIAANEKLVGTEAPPLEIVDLPFLLLQYRVVLAGFAVALLASPFLVGPLSRLGAAGAGEAGAGEAGAGEVGAGETGAARRARGLAAVVVWLVAGVVALVFLRRFADHMLIQVLPELCLGTAFAVTRLADRAAALHFVTQRRAPAARILVLLAIAVAAAGWEGRGPLRPASAAFEILARRRAGEPDWGDLSATIAAAIRPRLQELREGPRDLYVFGGPVLGIYAAAGQQPPTRFPFVEHLWAGYAPVDGTAEMARILAARPAFIVVDDKWLPDADYGDPWPVPEAAPVFQLLGAGLLRDYVRDGEPVSFHSSGGGLIGARGGVTVFRRRDVAPVQTAPGLAYAPAGR